MNPVEFVSRLNDASASEFAWEVPVEKLENSFEESLGVLSRFTSFFGDNSTLPPSSSDVDLPCIEKRLSKLLFAHTSLQGVMAFLSAKILEFSASSENYEKVLILISDPFDGMSEDTAYLLKLLLLGEYSKISQFFVDTEHDTSTVSTLCIEFLLLLSLLTVPESQNTVGY